MTDLLYILLTLVFFALMLGYVTACERLGRKSTTDGSHSTEQGS